MRIPRPILWTVLVIAVLIGLPAFIYFVIFDHQNEPLCHKQLMLELLNDLDQTGVFPNVQGRSADSIAKLFEHAAKDAGPSYVEAWQRLYFYVPGLRKDDPGDLVLMYMPQPTRYLWHGNPSSVFAEKKWILVLAEFTGPWGAGKFVAREISYGEQCERVSVDELRARLKKTLDFLRENDRPNWQTVVAEHEKFLAAVGDNRDN